MYNCYSTSESAFYTGAEDKTCYVLPWYKEKWKLRFILGGVVFVGIGITVFLLVSLFSVPSDLLGKDKSSVSVASPGDLKTLENPLISEVGNEKKRDCYLWRICDDKM